MRRKPGPNKRQTLPRARWAGQGNTQTLQACKISSCICSEWSASVSVTYRARTSLAACAHLAHSAAVPEPRRSNRSRATLIHTAMPSNVNKRGNLITEWPFRDLFGAGPLPVVYRCRTSCLLRVFSFYMSCASLLRTLPSQYFSASNPQTVPLSFV